MVGLQVGKVHSHSTTTPSPKMMSVLIHALSQLSCLSREEGWESLGGRQKGAGSGGKNQPRTPVLGQVGVQAGWHAWWCTGGEVWWWVVVVGKVPEVVWCMVWEG